MFKNMFTLLPPLYCFSLWGQQTVLKNKPSQANRTACPQKL
jgi:hypothetical protein